MRLTCIVPSCTDHTYAARILTRSRAQCRRPPRPGPRLTDLPHGQTGHGTTPRRHSAAATRGVHRCQRAWRPGREQWSGADSADG